MIYIEKADLDNWEFLCHNHKQKQKYILQSIIENCQKRAIVNVKNFDRKLETGRW